MAAALFSLAVMDDEMSVLNGVCRCAEDGLEVSTFLSCRGGLVTLRIRALKDTA